MLELSVLWYCELLTLYEVLLDSPTILDESDIVDESGIFLIFFHKYLNLSYSIYLYYSH